MKKIKTLAAAAAVFMLACFAGCQNVSTSQSLTFEVETGDRIKVTLDTTEGDSLSQDSGTILVNHGDEQILQGVFLTRDQYEAQKTVIEGTEGVELLTDEDEMISYYYEEGAAGPEAGYLFLVEHSDTGVYLASLADQETADQTFARLEFEKEQYGP